MNQTTGAPADQESSVQVVVSSPPTSSLSPEITSGSKQCTLSQSLDSQSEHGEMTDAGN